MCQAAQAWALSIGRLRARALPWIFYGQPCTTTAVQPFDGESSHRRRTNERPLLGSSYSALSDQHWRKLAIKPHATPKFPNDLSAHRLQAGRAIFPFVTQRLSQAGCRQRSYIRRGSAWSARPHPRSRRAPALLAISAVSSIEKHLALLILGTSDQESGAATARPGRARAEYGMIAVAVR